MAVWALSGLTKEERLRFEFIIDMGLSWSTMMRVFDQGMKAKLHEKIVNDFAERIFNVRSREEFVKVHDDF